MVLKSAIVNTCFKNNMLPKFPHIQFPGVTDFLFTMEEIRELIGGSPAGRELYVEAYAYDWFLVQGATGWAISVVHSNNVEVKLLGDSARTFKPNQTMDIYVSYYIQAGFL